MTNVEFENYRKIADELTDKVNRLPVLILNPLKNVNVVIPNDYKVEFVRGDDKEFKVAFKIRLYEDNSLGMALCLIGCLNRRGVDFYNDKGSKLKEDEDGFNLLTGVMHEWHNGYKIKKVNLGFDEYSVFFDIEFNITRYTDIKIPEVNDIIKTVKDVAERTALLSLAIGFNGEEGFSVLLHGYAPLGTDGRVGYGSFKPNGISFIVGEGDFNTLVYHFIYPKRRVKSDKVIFDNIMFKLKNELEVFCSKNKPEFGFSLVSIPEQDEDMFLNIKLTLPKLGVRKISFIHYSYTLFNILENIGYSAIEKSFFSTAMLRDGVV